MPHSKPPAADERATILVVDDTPDNLSLLSVLLKNIYKVKVANSGAKALAYLQGEAKPDLVLLDIMMPEMSGYDVIRELKAAPATRDIPVIFLSAMSSTADEEKGFEMGAADYITKPISPRTVLARVKTQLENRAAAIFLRDREAYLEAEVSRRIRDILTTREQQFV
jgi:putative two-component system response regulator